MWPCMQKHKSTVFFAACGHFWNASSGNLELNTSVNIRIASRTADHQCSPTVPVVSLLMALTSASG